MMLTLSLPPPLNQLYKVGGNKIYKSQAARLWEEEAVYEIRRQWKKKPFCEPVYCSVAVFYERDRDIDGSLKLLLDTLALGRVYENDRLIEHLVVTKTKSNKPRIEVEVEKLR